MKPFVHFTGTVSDEPKIIDTGRRPFLAFTVESPPDAYSQYPSRVKATCFDKDLNAVKAKVVKGAIIALQGEASVDAYLNTTTQKPSASLKVFVKSFEVFGGALPQAPAPAAAPARQSAPKTAAPATDDGEIPF